MFRKNKVFKESSHVTIQKERQAEVEVLKKQNKNISNASNKKERKYQRNVANKQKSQRSRENPKNKTINDSTIKQIRKKERLGVQDT